MNSFGTLSTHQGRFSIAGFLLLLLCSLVLGLITLRSPILAIVAVFGLPIFLLLRAKPELGILTIVVLISSIVFEDSLPLIPIGVGSLQISDVIFLSLIFVILFNSFAKKTFEFAKTPLDKMFFFFYAAVIISGIMSFVFYKVEFNGGMRVLRILTYYLLFFVVTNLIRSSGQIRFLTKGLFLIGTIVSIVMVIQAVVGESLKLISGRVELAQTFGEKYEAIRVLPPGHALIYVLFLVSVCVIALGCQGRIRIWDYVTLITTGVGVTLTYNRVYWVTCMICFGILILMVSGRSLLRRRLVAVFLPWLIGLGVLVSAFLILNPGVRFGGTTTAISARFTSLFAGNKLYKDESLEWRKIENRYALREISTNPLLGIGLGKEYRPKVFGPDDESTNYIHNGFLYIWLNLGFIGLVPLMLLFFSFIIRGFRAWKRIGDIYLQGLLIGFTLSMLGVLMINFISPMFMQWFSIVVLSIILGLGEAIIRINEMEVHKPGE